MAYNETSDSFDYQEGDLSDATISTIVKAFIVIGQFVVLIVLIMLYNWIKKKV